VIALTLPKLSMTMEEATVVAWLVADGDEVQEGQAYIEIETDKAQQELVAPAAGVLRIVAPAGSQVAFEGVLGELHDRSGEAATANPSAPAPVGGARRAAASPAARSVAAELGIDIETVVGTGPGGRIGVADVQAVAAVGDTGSGSDRIESPRPAVLASPASVGLRAAVVANIVASWQQIPHIHISGELVADGLADARRILAARGAAGISATDLLILALAQALAEVPELNGTVDPSGAPKPAGTIDLSLAVATDGGVVAPLIRDIAGRSLGEIARERARLVESARTGTLSPRDLGGGSVTLSNLGAYPVDFFAPVVTGPQIAALATGRAVRCPVAIGDAIGLGTRMTVNVAIDHRAADGEAGARLLAALERRFATLPDHV
jgi:pyruvate dehydrogenase E2 component (dihydrolipoamide acetyltransferase)